jgi:aconitate hydratase
VGLGVLPLQWPAGASPAALALDGSESFDLTGLDDDARPGQPVTLTVRRRDGSAQTVTLTLRVDTEAELQYMRRGGLLPYVLECLAAREDTETAAATGAR